MNPKVDRHLVERILEREELSATEEHRIPEHNQLSPRHINPASRKVIPSAARGQSQPPSV